MPRGGRQSVGQFVVPDVTEKDPSVIEQFFQVACNHESPARRELEAEWLQAKAFFDSIQWLSYDGGWGDSRKASFFVQQEEDEEDIPQTVTNEFLPIIDVHRSRMAKRKSKPYVRARRSNNSAAKVGSTLGDEVLEADCDAKRWPAHHRDAAFNCVLLGTGIIETRWLLDYRKTTKVGVLTAKRCPNGDCGFSLAKPAIGPKEFREIPPQMQGMLTQVPEFHDGGMDLGFQADKCLKCGAPLEDWTPAQGEEAEGEDVFGRALGNDVPLGDTNIQSRDLFDFFIENEGVKMQPGPLGAPGCPNWFAIDCVESVDNIACWYENGQEVKPESPETIARNRAVFGEYGSSSRGSLSVADRSLWRNHARLREFHQGPTRKNRLGRSIVKGGNVVLFNGPYLRESQADKKLVIPRVQVASFRFFPRHGEWWGQGLGIPLASPQRRINMTWSQIVDTRERNGVDGILATKGMQMSSPGWTRAFTGRIVQWEPDPEHPEMQPQPIPARLYPSEAYKEIEFTIERMREIAGVQEIDVGKTPAGITSGTALQLLGDKSSERGEMREAELIDACKSAWSHLLLLKREFVRESRTYWARSGISNVWQEKQFIGADLADQTDVVVDEMPNYDKKAFDREMTIQGINMGLLPIDTAYARREARKELGLQNNVADQESLQLDDAERKWHAFVEDGAIPVIEPNEDDHKTHWEVYGLGWKGQEGLEKKIAAQWDSLLPVLVGWEKDYQRQVQRRDQYEQMVLSGQMEMAMQNAKLAAEQGIPAPGPVTQILEEFKDYVPPPEAIEDHILAVWQERLTGAGIQVGPPPAAAPEIPGEIPLPPPVVTEEAEVQWSVLRMKAVSEAHYLYAQARVQAAQAGAAQIAAPAAEQTAAGTEPAPGQAAA